MSTDAVLCPRCKTENQAADYYCSKCNHELHPPNPEDEALMQPAEESEYERDQSLAGMIIAALGALGVIGMAVWLVATYTDVSEYTEPSAVQVTQLYTEASFWALIAIGLLLSGILWVLSTRE